MRLRTTVFVLSLLVAAPAAHADLIQNGGFETGDFTDWNASGDVDVTNLNLYGLGAYEGQYYAQFFGAQNTLSQTVTDTANQALTLTFYLANINPSGSVGVFQAYWDSQLLTFITQSQTSDWTKYSFTVTGTGNDTFYFFFLQDLQGAYWALDDVSLVPEQQQVPEPASFLILATGLVMTRLRWRRGRQ